MQDPRLAEIHKILKFSSPNFHLLILWQTEIQNSKMARIERAAVGWVERLFVFILNSKMRES